MADAIIGSKKPASWLFSPLSLLIFVLLVLCILLSLPLTIPIGPMYWDTYIYLDAAQRLKLGQIPAVDFSAPVGALEYYQFYWLQTLFPGGQPTLLAQWSVLISSAPLMAAVVAIIEKDNRKTAIAILVPFLIFALCPMNTQTFHSYPGVSGFGIYNRHTSLLLYVLTSALIFLPRGRSLAIVAALTMLALFFTKITGFLAGGLIGLYAVIAGRFLLRHLLLALAVFVIILAGFELNNGMVSAYMANIITLVSLNEGLLIPRFLTVFSIKLDVMLAAASLIFFLFWLDRSDHSTWRKDKFYLDRDWLWAGVIMVAGTFLETQNTGSQEFIFIWPVLLAVLYKTTAMNEIHRLIVYCLVALTIIPTTTKVVHGTLRFIAVAPHYVSAPVSDIKTMGLVSTRADIMERVLLLENHYIQNAETYRQLAVAGQLPSWRLYAELDYQMFWLLSLDNAVKAIKQFESDNNIRLNSLMNLDFTDPFPWILDRDATRHIQIGADPFRTVERLTPVVEASVRATDGVLRPTCPITTARRYLQDIYAKALDDRTVVKLNDCWDLLLRPDLKAVK
ncbi:hypothetical protein [Phyllobacterium sp. YR531]|uniref:hypothetical protein n=1 Tax=Phyllobacterium sp. YR531 TaxID=1144343 RepID=UPI00026F7E42|nr:hypothetical protein [Phyllobacterium sp. YR531]EJN03990.1 hypothetical protein PMI41_01625 [Phyllobacterium sp. YR531]